MYACVGRRDKYERHLKEFWVDVATEGTLAKSMVEQVSQSFEIVDFDCSLPAPTLGSSPKPDLERCSDDSDGEEQDAGSSSSDDEEGKKAAGKSKEDKKRIAKTGSKKCNKKAKAEAEDKVEEALEACGKHAL